MLEWLKTVLGDAYTPEIDTAVSQEIGKGFVARTDFNTKTAKVTELETEVKQLREGTRPAPQCSGRSLTLRCRWAPVSPART